MPDIRGGPGDLETAKAFTALGSATSSIFYAAPGNSVVTFSFESTKAGGWIIYGLCGSDFSDAVALISSRAVTANVRDAATVQGNYGAYYIIFTDTSNSTGTYAARVEGCDVPNFWGSGS